MTDISRLVRRLRNRIKWQKTPDDLYDEELSELIAEAIEKLYVKTTRQHEFSWSKFEKDGDLYISYADTLHPEEERYVLLCAQYDFFSAVSTNYDEMVSYTTDALSVTHGDKPFQNVNTIVERLRDEVQDAWHQLDIQYRHLGAAF